MYGEQTLVTFSHNESGSISTRPGSGFSSSTVAVPLPTTRPTGIEPGSSISAGSKHITTYDHSAGITVKIHWISLAQRFAFVNPVLRFS